MVMKRRTFIKNTSYVALGVSVFGNIIWKAGKFVGDTPTTTDILGHFYRPNSPIRIGIGYSDDVEPVLIILTLLLGLGSENLMA